MGDCCVRIDRFSNGYTVEIKDPAIVKANNKPSKPGSSYSYKDPWKTFVFKSDTEVLAFLKANLKKAIVSTDDGDEYSSTFKDVASQEMD